MCSVGPHLNLPDSTGDDRFQHWPTLVVQQVDLIDDHKLHQLRVRAVAALAGDDVPFLGRCDDDLLEWDRD